MKKLTCALICALLILPLALSGCHGNGEPPASEAPESSSGKSETETSGSSKPVDEDKYRDENGKYVAFHLPEFKEEWKSYEEFRVLVYDEVGQTTYFSEEIESREALAERTDQYIIEGVNTRNNWINDTYGIKIKAVAVKDLVSEFRSQASSGTDTFDVAMPFMAACGVFAQEGSLYDLRDFSEYIDLDAPWWDNNATSSLSIGNRVYFTTGDLSIMQKIVSGGLVFNKKLMTENNPGINMYDLVREGEWTLDVFYEMAKKFTRQGNEDQKMDENDYWGCMGGDVGLYYAAGETLCSKNAEDIPQISIGVEERSINVAQKVLEMLGEKGTWYVTVNDFTDKTDMWDTTVKIFGTGQSLFMAIAFSAVKKFRPYEVNYGVVPPPKFDKDQDGYFSRCTANMAYGICIPLQTTDPEFCAYMIELLAVGGKNHISNAYYTSVLKGKDMATEDDEDMLDIIFNNIIYDTALVYSFGGLSNIFNTANKDTFISTLDGMKDSVELAIQEVVDAYAAY